MEIKTVKIKELKSAIYNPRKWSDEAREHLTESIKKFGIVDPLLVNSAPKRKNILIGGHFRLKIAKELGFEEVPVVYVNIPNVEKEKELNLRLNKNTGDWDWDILKDFDVEKLMEVGFGDDDLSQIWDDMTEIEEEDDRVPEVPKKPKSKMGDIYQLGRHRILAGDSTKREDVEKLMDGKKAQMCFTDPPYNVNYTGGMGTHEKNKREGILNDKMDSEEFCQFLSEMSKRIIENVKGGVYICMSSSELNTLKTVWESNGGHWQSFIIWVKNNFTLSRADYQHMYEPILYGWADGIVKHYFSQDRDRANVWEDLRKVKSEYKDGYTTISFQGFKVKIKGKVEEGQVIRKKQKTDIWRYDKPVKSSEHPTMKPVALVSEALLGSSKIRNIVLDLFLGSGSTLIACEKTNRTCYGMELDCHYIDVIIQRYENYTGKKAKKIS